MSSLTALVLTYNLTLNPVEMWPGHQAGSQNELSAEPWEYARFHEVPRRLLEPRRGDACPAGGSETMRGLGACTGRAEVRKERREKKALGGMRCMNWRVL